MPPSSVAPFACLFALAWLPSACLSVANDSSAGSPSASEVTGVDSAIDGAMRISQVPALATCLANARGSLGASPSALATNRTAGSNAELSPQFVYATNQNSHDVSAYRVDASGSLTPMGAAVGVGKYPEAIALLPTGTGLFVANHGSNSVSGFKVDATTGTLTSTGPPIATAAAGPTALLAHPTGSFVYAGSDDATSRTPNSVTAYRVDATSGGLITLGAKSTDGAGLVAMTVDPTGRFLYTANTLSDDLSVFSIDPCDGTLSKVGGNVASAFPVSLTVDPTGKFLYVAAGGSDPAVQTFGIDALSGALSPIDDLKGVSPPWGLKALQLDATGRFLFLVTVGQASASSIRSLAIDSLTGIPSAIPGASVFAGANALPVAIDRSGRFAYIGNFGSNDISAYSLDGGTGTFTSIGTFPAGTAPGALAVSSGRAF